ncbi:low affinity iron permease family protein [candidate division WWE3 bacterium]|nr:low affinity iron permease family protein [candidate division WWE3 bacterium]
MNGSFEKFSEYFNRIVGSPLWFVLSITLIIVWFLSGFLIGFDGFWQLLINTTTTILTFLMVSLLQTSQNKWEKRMDSDQEREQKNLGTILEELKKVEDNIIKSGHKD